MPSSIQAFQFVTMDGEHMPAAEELELIRRQGVDGVAIWQTGERGRPFSVTTGVDAPTFASTQSVFTSYQSLLTAGAVSVVWNNYPLPYQVKVIDVRKVASHAISTAVGGLFPPSLGWLSCEWDLIAVN